MDTINVNEETVKSAIARTKEAIERRAEQARIAEAEKQQLAQDEKVITEQRKRLALVSRQHGIEQDAIHEIERDNAVARKRIAEWTASIERQEIALKEHKEAAAPLAKELAELRALLRGVDQV